AHRQPAPREPRQCGRPAPPPWAFGAVALRLLERRGGLAAEDARRSRSRGDGPGRPDDSPRPARGLHVSLELQVWLLLWGTLVGLDLVSVPQMMIARPLVAGPIAGAILGDVGTGLQLGVLFELFQYDILPMGATRYPEYGPATVAAVSAAHAAAGTMGLGLGALVGLITGMAGGLSLHALRQLNTRAVRRGAAALEAGDPRPPQPAGRPQPAPAVHSARVLELRADAGHGHRRRRGAAAAGPAGRGRGRRCGVPRRRGAGGAFLQRAPVPVWPRCRRGGARGAR